MHMTAVPKTMGKKNSICANASQQIAVTAWAGTTPYSAKLVKP
jgi:hypothetical protein